MSRVEWLNVILFMGADPDKRDDEGRTRLHLCKDAASAWLLLKYKASPHARDNSGKTPLHYCNDLSIAKMLLHAKADPDAKDNSGLMPIDCISNASVRMYILHEISKKRKLFIALHRESAYDVRSLTLESRLNVFDPALPADIEDV